MLEEMRDSLVPGTGRIIIALVLPYKPFVEHGMWCAWVSCEVVTCTTEDGTYSKPVEYLDIEGDTWEDNVQSLVDNVFTPLDLSVEVCVLCCAVLCCAVLCCAVLCCAVLCCASSRIQPPQSAPQNGATCRCNTNGGRR